MQFSELLSPDAAVCYRDHEGTSLAAAGMLPVQQGKYRISAHCCTALVGAEALLRAEGTEKGAENIPLL